MSTRSGPPRAGVVAGSVPPRVALLGLPRSGTSWMANLIAAHPAVALVNEPDNRDLDLLGWLGTGALGVIPSLGPGERATDYRTMWRVAFAGGWPADGPLATATRTLRRIAGARVVPRPLQATALRTAGRLTAHRTPAAPVVLVKSVRSMFTVDWVSAEFDPALLVVWRHPLNVVSSWLDKGWHTHWYNGLPSVRHRFAHTPLWPVPEDALGWAAWTVCAHLTILLETVVDRPAALVLNHERSAQDPRATAEHVLGWLGLDWDDAIAAFVAANDRRGEGFTIQRRTADEPTVWRGRLDREQARVVLEWVERFQGESPAVAARWPTSPAVAP